MPFQRELSMEAYIIENDGVLTLDNDIFNSVEIIEAELALKQGRKSKDTDGRIDILVKYSEEYIGIIELKLGQLEHVHLEQLEDYLLERNRLLSEYPDLISPELSEKPKWIGVLVGTSIDPGMERKISDGYLTRDDIPIAALTIQRYRGNDDQIYVVTDTYFNNKASTKDYTKYIFNGKIYGKGRLVLSVVSKFVEEHPDVTYSELVKVFPKTTQGSRGVFTLQSEAEDIYASTSRKRHFINPEDIIQVKDAAIAVCTQWGASNIGKFISVAREHGYDIDQVNG
ncbi:hypothetical protein BMS3Abin07_00215 [bacterium BMS3Abin07]|nr:hypothetical protein BMS3Abin07_00215 [bacterium BMS3Abin07]